jgi:hypothetical protein
VAFAGVVVFTMLASAGFSAPFSISTRATAERTSAASKAITRISSMDQPPNPLDPAKEPGPLVAAPPRPPAPRRDEQGERSDLEGGHHDAGQKDQHGEDCRALSPQGDDAADDGVAPADEQGLRWL